MVCRWRKSKKAFLRSWFQKQFVSARMRSNSNTTVDTTRCASCGGLLVGESPGCGVRVPRPLLFAKNCAASREENATSPWTETGTSYSGESATVSVRPPSGSNSAAHELISWILGQGEVARRHGTRRDEGGAATAGRDRSVGGFGVVFALEAAHR